MTDSRAAAAALEVLAQSTSATRAAAVGLEVLSKYTYPVLAGQYAAAVLADSPLVYLRLDETSGTAFYDSSGNGRNAELGGTGTTLNAAGLVRDGRAVTFNGNGTITIRHDPTLDAAANYTVEFVMQSSTGGGSYRYIAKKYGVQGWMIRYHNTEFNPYATTSGGLVLPADTSQNMADGAIHHVALTLNGAVLTCYIDGVVASTATGTGTQTDNTADIIIAAAGGDGPGYVGGIDEFAFYGTDIGATRISAHYQAMRARFAPAPQQSYRRVIPVSRSRA